MSALDKQVGGDHYKTLAIQPIEYVMANKLGFVEGNVIKYVTRWRSKGGIKDLEKAIHFLEMLIEEEKKNTTLEKEAEISPMNNLFGPKLPAGYRFLHKDELIGPGCKYNVCLLTSEKTFSDWISVPEIWYNQPMNPKFWYCCPIAN